MGIPGSSLYKGFILPSKLISRVVAVPQMYMRLKKKVFLYSSFKI